MTKAFNLLDEPWLSVKMLNGAHKELGLLALFQQADKIAFLTETAPPALIAQYRLLLAITHRALCTALPDWQPNRSLWFKQGLPSSLIIQYLEQWRERFWLFHPEHPFMQVAALASAPETADKRKPWTQIDLACASGNAPVVFSHSLDAVPSRITPAAAIRHLLGFLQSTPGGLVKTFRDADKAGPLANTAAILPLGNTLTQTLLLALHAPSGASADLPCWERPALTIQELRGAPTPASGPNDRYTRQTRAVLLLREVCGDICYLRFAAGLGLEDDPTTVDPMACYRAGINGQVRLTFVEGRSLWRDLPALLPDDGSHKSAPAPILIEACQLARVLAIPVLPLLIAGLACEQAKLLRWRSEVLSLPLVLFEQPTLTTLVCELLEKAEMLFTELKQAGIQLIAGILPDSQKKDTRNRARILFDVSPAARVYFCQLEPALMVLLGEIEKQPQQASQQWMQSLKLAALKAWEVLLAYQGGGSRLWRSNAKAEPRLQLAINQYMAVATDGNGLI
ncbi:type I-E CRISPR-associated protein Cse1/CasA [Serratia microhaemolytica]|uniref:type I-E CRISPR-associated protein Cse1/CasA n=1 Tax=Serratia microhaemolytica TaxID=2675110 RepID=UPI000FDEE7B8|nr:type I-E CRISPR-associated protein Cse1/CasA [Serratia microhaemolytica]